MKRHRLLPVAAAALAVAVTAGCSGSSGAPAAAGSSGSAGSAGPAAPAVRWWSDPAAAKGSTIDPSAPSAAARSLSSSRPGYCSVLRQSVAAGKSVLSGAGGPARLATTQAFVSELGALAPASIAPAWHVLGPALVSVVQAGGSVTGLDAHAVASAASTIAADAKSSCGVTLSS